MTLSPSIFDSAGEVIIIAHIEESISPGLPTLDISSTKINHFVRSKYFIKIGQD